MALPLDLLICRLLLNFPKSVANMIETLSQLAPLRVLYITIGAKPITFYSAVASGKILVCYPKVL